MTATETREVIAAEGAARRERRAEWRAAIAFLVTTAAALGLTVVYWRGGQPQLEGLLLGTALGGLAYGITTYANRLLPAGPFVEDRHPLSTGRDVSAALDRDLRREPITRRKLLRRTFPLAIGALGVAALFPIRSLGPNPGKSLLRTPWRRGVRAVTDDGRPVRPEDVPDDGLVTIFPEGSPGSADGQAVLLRVDPGLLKPKPGREAWTPGGLVAYSKVCTHAGCPVGLYEAQAHTLLCPCHQSTFDVLQHARPTFGPAAAALPQLPLAIDAAGFLVATGDFSEPVGPAFWHRT